VIGSRVSGLPMAIGEGTNGWLMEEGSVADLRRTLSQALADRQRLAAFGAASRARAQSEFSWDAVAARYRAAYVAAARHRAGRDSA
jgi:glycosyltransferase involved in cell wall biosynthesis